MAKKKTSKTKKESNKEDKKHKSLSDTYDSQLFWFLLAVVVLFASFLVPYLFIENSKYFVYANSEWVIEEYPDFTAYHARFPRFDNLGGFHNIWLRNDPRELEVPSLGEFNSWRVRGVIAFDETVGECTGEVSRASGDLADFIANGIGARSVEVGTTDPVVAEELNRSLVNCFDTVGRTVVILQEGKSSVIQDEINEYCYTINVETCEDIKGIEYFMVKALNDTLVISE